MTESFYKPWIGSNYRKTGTLILAESVYNWREDGKGLLEPDTNHPTTSLKWNIKHFGKGSGKTYFEKMTQALCGSKHPNVQECQAAWNDYVYLPYVQQSVGEGARKRPTKAMWAAAKADFQHLIARIKPAPLKIIVTGLTMWDKVPDTQAMLTKRLQAYRLPVDCDERLVWALALPHPSNSREGFSWRDTAPRITVFNKTVLPTELLVLL